MALNAIQRNELSQKIRLGGYPADLAKEYGVTKPYVYSLRFRLNKKRKPGPKPKVLVAKETTKSDTPITNEIQFLRDLVIKLLQKSN